MNAQRQLTSFRYIPETNSLEVQISEKFDSPTDPGIIETRSKIINVDLSKNPILNQQIGQISSSIISQYLVNSLVSSINVAIAQPLAQGVLG